MFKFLCLLLLCIFGGAGVLLLFSDIGSLDKSENMRPSGDKGGISLPFKENYGVASALAERIAGDCYGRDLECSAFRVYDYVRNNFTLDGEAVSGDSKPLSEVIINRKGNNEELAKLTVYLLNDAGVPSLTEGGKNGITPYACGIDVPKFYDIVKKHIRSKPLAARELTLKKNAVWAVDLKSSEGKPFSIDFLARGDKNFDAVLFPSETDMRSYLKDGSGRYLETCAIFGTSEVELSCVAPFGSKLAFISKEDNNAFKGEVFRGGFLIGDIKTKDIGEKACFAVNVDY